MPFTPYHFGPSSWIGLLLMKVFDMPSLIISCVIVDIEPFLVLSFKLNYPLHGYAHTFLFGALIAFLLAMVIYKLKRYIIAVTAVFKLSQDSAFLTIIYTSIFGVYSHVVLDSMLYADIKPFWPLDANPFLNVLTARQVYGFCLISFIPGIILYLWHCTRRLNNETTELLKH